LVGSDLEAAGLRSDGEAAPDELDLKRELSEICHKTGLVDWEPLVKAIFDWLAEATGRERSRRLDALNRLVQELQLKSCEQLKTTQDQHQPDESRARIHQLLKAFVDKLPVKKMTRT
jgi:hypothetical protein